MKKPDPRKAALKALLTGDSKAAEAAVDTLLYDNYCAYNPETGLYHDITAGPLLEFAGPGIKRDTAGIHIQAHIIGDYQIHFFKR